VNINPMPNHLSNMNPYTECSEITSTDDYFDTVVREHWVRRARCAYWEHLDKYKSSTASQMNDTVHDALENAWAQLGKDMLTPDDPHPPPPLKSIAVDF
jgi:hypothetical protein